MYYIIVAALMFCFRLEISRAINVGNCNKKCDRDPGAGPHLIRLLFDLDAHSHPHSDEEYP
jgi:hypothetical protein